MVAIDTNVVVRILAGDDLTQEALAAKRIAGGCIVSHGVLMETEWVLRRSFGWDRRAVNAALVQFIALEILIVRLPDQLIWALEQHLAGADWADMLHLIAARQQSAFATFDRALALRSTFSPVPIELLR